MTEYPPTFASLTVNIEAQAETARQRLRDETPCRLLIVGDFSGRANRGPAAKGTVAPLLRPLQVDRDNLEELPGKLGASLLLPPIADGRPLRIDFTELEDFHPDQLYDRLEIFQQLRQLRRSLQNPASFAAAAAEVRSLLAPPPSAARQKPTPAAAPAPPPHPGGSLLEAIMEETGAGSAPGAPAPDAPLQQFLQTLVAPHLLPATDEEEAMVAAVDGLTAALMRAILHHPDVQALEAAWRGVQLLLARLNADESLQLFLLDLSQEEWAADLHATDLLEKSALATLLLTQAQQPGAVPWALVAGVYSFAGTDEEAELLGRMARICARAAVPFIAAAEPALVGCSAGADLGRHLNECAHLPLGQGRLWSALRALPEAVWLGLALPRLLLRLPYGSDTDPLDRFAFEEQEDSPHHGQYLWGNPIFACCCLLGRNFLHQGRFQPAEILEIDALPLHILTTGGVRSALPCAEYLLTLKAAEALLAAGLMPLLSFKDQDRIRLARVQSIAQPLAPLADGRSPGGAP